MPRRRAAKNQTEKTSSRLQIRDVNAVVRVKNALSLYLAGNSWQTIADSSGFASRGAAYNAVQRELQRDLQLASEEIRRAELMRLDSLVSVFYPKAMSGDGWSCDRVLRIMERRALYLGLDTTAQTNIAAQVLIRQYSAEVESV